MRLYREDYQGFSEAVIIQMAIMLEMIWGAEIIAYKVSSTLDYESKTRKSIFQEKKKRLNRARTQLTSVLKDLEFAYQEYFDDIFSQSIDGVFKYDIIQDWANDLVHLALIYWARGDGDMARKDAMKRALLNFKAVNDIDINELLKYYKAKNIVE